jgi:two-component system cell cycle sensor histidine kinase/response regulator CckA
LLAFSRKQTLLPQHIDIYEVLSDLTHLLNRLMGERMRLELHHAPGLGPIRADKRQLEQVVVNLVVNARDAMSAGGTIRISTEAVTLNAELRRDRAVVPPGDYALIRVTDTGHGIPPDRLTKIFEPFYTTKRPGEGTGLGLSTAYGIVKQSGGFIFVDSEPGVGTTFQLYFPINARAAAEVPATPAPIPLLPRLMLRQGEAVVLLVEDEAPVRAFAARALRLRGYTVLEADSAETALALLEDKAVQVDIIVTDVVMPGLDGPSWVRRALEDRPDMRVVFVSGYAQESFADTQGLIANSVFLPKPFSLTDLTATVQGQLMN